MSFSGPSDGQDKANGSTTSRSAKILPHGSCGSRDRQYTYQITDGLVLLACFGEKRRRLAKWGDRDYSPSTEQRRVDGLGTHATSLQFAASAQGFVNSCWAEA